MSEFAKLVSPNVHFVRSQPLKRQSEKEALRKLTLLSVAPENDTS